MPIHNEFGRIIFFVYISEFKEFTQYIVFNDTNHLVAVHTVHAVQ
jgi:hypothetical protein